MEILEVIVGEGGVLHVENLPYEAGKRLKITLEEEKAAMTEEEWRAHLREFSGSLPDFEIEEFDRNYPEPIEPLFLKDRPDR